MEKLRSFFEFMKSAYELAMERLNKTGPSVKLTAEQKKAIAEIDSVYSARVAEREIFLKSEIQKSAAKGDFEAVEQLQRQLVSERKKLELEKEEKKQQAREVRH